MYNKNIKKKEINKDIKKKNIKTDNKKKEEEKIKLIIEMEKYRFNECHGGC